MAQECMDIFEKQKLPAAASVEQVSHKIVDLVIVLLIKAIVLCYWSNT